MNVQTFHAKLSEPSATFIRSNCSLTSFFLPANVQKPQSVTTLTKLLGNLTLVGEMRNEKQKGNMYQHVTTRV